MSHRKQIGAPEPSFLQRTWDGFLNFWKWLLPSCTTATEVAITATVAGGFTALNGGGSALNEMVLPTVHQGVRSSLDASSNALMNRINNALDNNATRLEDHPEIRVQIDRVEDTISSVVNTAASVSRTVASTALNALRSPNYIKAANDNINSAAETVKDAANEVLSNIEHELIQAQNAGGILPYAIESTASFVAKNVNSFIPETLVDAHSAVTNFLEEALGLNNGYDETETPNNRSFFDYILPFGEVSGNAWGMIGEIGKHMFHIQ